jgi:NAD+ diphosphatase
MTTYPDLAAIPFNNYFIRDAFVPGLPQYVDQSFEPGYWGVIQGNSILLYTDGITSDLPRGELPEWLVPPENTLKIGTWHGRPLRIFSIDAEVPIKPPYRVEALNAVVQTIDNSTLGIGGLAKQILHWEQQSSFCSICGGTTNPFTREWGRQCSVCASKKFPQIAPCAIVLVQRDQEILLVRNAAWPTGRYSLAAGFLGIGESLEECAAREVREETGIEIADITYVGSQSWPFPSQIMTGFVATYAGGELVVDYGELEDARWFPVTDLPTLPPTRSIARRIIDSCCR